jgi:ABC-type multidrug transport system ATPase subunit
MDVEGRRAFWSAIRADAARGRTVVFATHYLDEADEYADRIVLMSRGRIVADGSTAEIKNLVSGRIVRATLPGADPADSRPPRRRRRRVRGRPHQHPHEGLGCRRPPPPHRDGGARRRDHVPEPRERLPRPHLRRSLRMSTASSSTSALSADRVTLDRRVPPLGGFTSPTSASS